MNLVMSLVRNSQSLKKKLGGILNGKWSLLRYTYETMRLDSSKIDDELYKGLTYAIKTVKDHIETT